MSSCKVAMVECDDVYLSMYLVLYSLGVWLVVVEMTLSVPFPADSPCSIQPLVSASLFHHGTIILISFAYIYSFSLLSQHTLYIHVFLARL